MNTPILATKLYIPTPRPDLVSRPRLLRRVADGLVSGYRLTLISAPAGFGKTTLLSEWAQSCDRPLAWLMLDEDDNDPVRFWRYVIAALQRVDPGIGDSLQPVLQSNPLPVEALVSELVNDIAAVSDPFLLVLEDYHLVNREEIHAGMNFLLNHMPEPLHLVITTRADPPLQLSRRRARREVNEIRAADLRFDTQDVDALFNTALRLNLPGEEIAALENRTEGWIAGLQMAALSLQGRGDAHAFIQAFMGDDRYIADYLVEEVLQRQPEEIQSFLLETSVLKRLSAPLCDAVTGRTDSQAVLNALERANLFILPLDNRREWFRYHRLFAELLRQNLAASRGPGEIKRLQKKAASWFQQAGNYIEAVDYALDCGESGIIAMMVLSASPDMFLRSELITVLSWANRTAPEVLAGQPGLCFMYAWAAHATGHTGQVGYFLSFLDQAAGMSLDASLIGFDDPALTPFAKAALAEASVMRARIAVDEMDTAHTLAIGRAVLPYLMSDQREKPFFFNPPDNLRAPLLFIMGLAYKIEGDLSAADRYFSAAVEEARKGWINTHVVALCTAHLGDTQMLQGRLNEAEAAYQQALRYDREFGLGKSAFFGMSLVGLGMVALERNDLEKARRFFEDGIELARLWNIWECLLPGYLGIARIECALSHWEAAEQALDEMEKAGGHAGAVVRPAVAQYRARLDLLRDRLESAEAWARTCGLDPEGAPAPAREEEALTLARVMLAQGQMEAACDLAERVARQAGSGERRRRVIAARVFQAQATQPEEDASRALLQALEMAEPEGYVRLFLDEGAPIRTRLARIHSRGEDRANPRIQAYVQRILAAFEAEPGIPAGSDLCALQPGRSKAKAGMDADDQGLVETLSERELEVLRLIAGGATNPEIAQKVYISVNTVKKHVTNIYGKLGVTTRVQAVETARRLGLI